MTIPAAKRAKCALGIAFLLFLIFFDCVAARKSGKSGPAAPGVVVEGAAPGSEAARAGIRKGDVLLRWTLTAQGTKGELRTVFDWEALQIRNPVPAPLEIVAFRQGRELLFKTTTAAKSLAVRPPLPQALLPAYQQAAALSQEGKAKDSGHKLAEIAVRAWECGDKGLSLWLRLQAISELLRGRDCGAAVRLYGEALGLASAGSDESLCCVVQQKAWDFYSLVRRQPVTFSADGLALAGTFYDVPGWTGRQTVILSHGSSAWGQGHPFTVMTALELARLGYEVFTFDYRGFGASQDPRDVDTAAALDFSRDLAAAIDLVKGRKENAGGRIVLLGHSFGAGPTLACGFARPDVAALVAVGPARRVRERNLAADAPRGIEELRRRLKADMELNRLPGAEAARETAERMLIDNFAGKTFTRPLLLIDGQKEKPELRKFLADLAATMKGPVTYHSLPGAGHYFGLDGLRDRFKKRKGGGEDIGLSDLARACGEQCDGKVDLALFFRFIADIDAWLGQLFAPSSK